MRREERGSAPFSSSSGWTHSPTGCTDGARETEEETGARCCWQPSQSERTGGGVGVAGERPCPRGDGAVMLLAQANISVIKLFLDRVVSGRAPVLSEPDGSTRLRTYRE